jgi:putative DNA primase/helicase
MTDIPPELPPPDDPMAVARKYVLEHHDDDDGVHLLRRHIGGFYRWTGASWPELLDDDLRASVYAWAEPAVYWKPVKVKGETTYELTPWAPTRYKVDNVVDALRAVAHLDSRVTAPAWIDDPLFHHHPAAIEIVAMGNGLLHLPTRSLAGHTPAFWTHHSLPFDFDPAASAPELWLTFLHEL